MLPEVYSDSLIAAGVCAPNEMQPDTILEIINTGRRRPWKIGGMFTLAGVTIPSAETPEERLRWIREYARAPCPCPDKPATHRHFVLRTGSDYSERSDGSRVSPDEAVNDKERA